MAARDCRRRGYRVVARNVRVRGGEIDILAEDRAGNLVVIEVRGRRTGERLPSRWLSEGKRRRLLRLAARIAAKERKVVRVQLVEIVGAISWWTLWWPWRRPVIRCYWLA